MTFSIMTLRNMDLIVTQRAAHFLDLLIVVILGVVLLFSLTSFKFSLTSLKFSLTSLKFSFALLKFSFASLKFILT
jgi:hypothetical protein